MIVYVATNAVNEMQYVGITSRKLSDRKYGHLKRASEGKGGPASIWEAIRQHGNDNFSFKVIDETSDIESLREREIYWIKRLNTITPHGYNQNKGGSITTAEECAKEYRINGKSYFGFGQLADAFGLEEGTVRARIKYSGWTLNKPLGLHHRLYIQERALKSHLRTKHILLNDTCAVIITFVIICSDNGIITWVGH